MKLEPGYLLASLLVGSIGFVLFTYGRKRRRMPHASVGLVMLVYPYFVADVAIMLALCAALCALCWGMVRLRL